MLRPHFPFGPLSLGPLVSQIQVWPPDADTRPWQAFNVHIEKNENMHGEPTPSKP